VSLIKSFDVTLWFSKGIDPVKVHFSISKHFFGGFVGVHWLTHMTLENNNPFSGFLPRTMEVSQYQERNIHSLPIVLSIIRYL